MSSTYVHSDLTFTVPISPGRVLQDKITEQPKAWLDVKGKRVALFYGVLLTPSGDLLVDADVATVMHEAPEIICFVDCYLVDRAQNRSRWVRLDAPNLPVPKPQDRNVRVSRVHLRRLEPTELSNTGGQLVWAQAPWDTTPPPEDLDARARTLGGTSRPRGPAQASTQEEGTPTVAWYASGPFPESPKHLLAAPRYRGSVCALLAHPKGWQTQEVVTRSERLAKDLSELLGTPVTARGGYEDFLQRYGAQGSGSDWDRWPIAVATSTTRGNFDYQYLVVPVSMESPNDTHFDIGRGVGMLVRTALQSRLPVLGWDHHTGKFYYIVKVSQESRSFAHGWRVQFGR